MTLLPGPRKPTASVKSTTWPGSRYIASRRQLDPRYFPSFDMTAREVFKSRKPLSCILSVTFLNGMLSGIEYAEKKITHIFLGPVEKLMSHLSRGLLSFQARGVINCNKLSKI